MAFRNGNWKERREGGREEGGRERGKKGGRRAGGREERINKVK